MCACVHILHYTHIHKHTHTHTHTHTQVAALGDSVRALEQRLAAAAVESAARVEALGVQVAAADAGRAALKEQLQEHEQLASEERACAQERLKAVLHDLHQGRELLARYTKVLASMCSLARMCSLNAYEYKQIGDHAPHTTHHTLYEIRRA